MDNTLALERMQIAAAIAPQALTTARTGYVASFKNYRRILVVFFKGIGTAGDDPTITLLQGTDIAFGTSKAINFTKVWTKMDLTKLSDVGQWTETTQSAANTYTDATSAEQMAIWAIEVKAEDLDVDNGYDCIRASISDVGTNAQYGCVFYIGLDPLYPASPANMRSMIAD
jgi:hypothetical protein